MQLPWHGSVQQCQAPRALATVLCFRRPCWRPAAYLFRLLDTPESDDASWPIDLGSQGSLHHHLRHLLLRLCHPRSQGPCARCLTAIPSPDRHLPWLHPVRLPSALSKSGLCSNRLDVGEALWRLAATTTSGHPACSAPLAAGAAATTTTTIDQASTSSQGCMRQHAQAQASRESAPRPSTPNPTPPDCRHAQLLNASNGCKQPSECATRP